MSSPSVEPPVHRIALPAGVTLAGVFCGLLSMSWAESRPYAACCAIIGAGLFDMIDGRVARLVNGRSSFGAELDSLADVVSFGVAPAWLAYCWVLAAAGDGSAGGLVAPFVFVACAAVRLARYNVKDASSDGPDDRFGGLPTPAGALLVVTPIMVSYELEIDALRAFEVVASLLVVAGALMVSRIPLKSYKTFPNRIIKFSYYGLIAFGLTLLVLGLPGGTVLFGFVVYYVFSGVVTGLAERSRRRAEQPVV